MRDAGFERDRCRRRRSPEFRVFVEFSNEFPHRAGRRTAEAALSLHLIKTKARYSLLYPEAFERSRRGQTWWSEASPVSQWINLAGKMSTSVMRFIGNAREARR